MSAQPVKNGTPPRKGPQQRPAQPQPPQKPQPPRKPSYERYEKAKSGAVKYGNKALGFLNRHILLRNLVMALCLGLVFVFLVSLFLNIYTRHGQKYFVPDFIGSNMGQAEELARKGDLQLVVVDSIYMPGKIPGLIIDQTPKADATVKSGRRILLTVNAYRPKAAPIPYVTGLSLRQAKNTLESRGFEIERIVYRADMATNNVLSQSYNGQTINKGDKIEAELGSKILLTVGKNTNAGLPRIPKVVGLTLREAKSRLWEMGINLGTVRFDNDVKIHEQDQARVYRQDPAQFTRIDFGGSVSLWLTTDKDKVGEASREADNRTIPMAEDEDSTVTDEIEDEAFTIADPLSR